MAPDQDQDGLAISFHHRLPKFVDLKSLVLVRVGVGLLELGRDDIDFRPSGLEGYAGSQPAHQEPVVVATGDGIAVARPWGYPEVRVVKEAEARRQHTHHGDYGDPSTMRVRPNTPGSPPNHRCQKPVADDDLAGPAGGSLLDGEGATQRRGHAQGLEEVRGREGDAGLLGFVSPGHGDQ